MKTAIARMAAVFCLGGASAAQALDYDLGPVKVTLNSKFSSGVAWRLQDRNGALKRQDHRRVRDVLTGRAEVHEG